VKFIESCKFYKIMFRMEKCSGWRKKERKASDCWEWVSAHSDSMGNVALLMGVLPNKSSQCLHDICSELGNWHLSKDHLRFTYYSLTHKFLFIALLSLRSQKALVTTPCFCSWRFLSINLAQPIRSSGGDFVYSQTLRSRTLPRNN
jgi:hypothetical protein